MRILSCALLVGLFSYSAGTTWTPAQLRFAPAGELHPMVSSVQAAKTFKLDVKAFESELSKAPLENSTFSQVHFVLLPYPDGTLRQFKIVNSPILSPDLAKRIPINTYIVQGVDDPHATGRVDFGKFGFHGTIFSPEGDYSVEPMRRSNITDYFAYFRRDQVFRVNPWGCHTEESKLTPDDGFSGIQTTGSTLRTYRLALNTTTEYTAVFGSIAAAEAAAVTSISRVTGIYERDTAIRMNIVYLKCWTGVDPFTQNNLGQMLAQNQSNLDTAVGNANYDIGHVFSSFGGGLAAVGVVGLTGQKARGVTGLTAPMGDIFDIDFVSHEIGHQYSANHSFNGTTGSCGGGARSAASAFEPGSGSTIMGYAGICGAENLQSNSDAYFHTASIDSVLTIRSNSSRGGFNTSTLNLPPIVDAGPNRSIPIGTPFKLTATASDPNFDPLTYCWEQYDLGTASPTADTSTRPLFRSLSPSTSRTRFFPKLADVLSGAPTPWETLPTVARTMNFRATVRDNRTGGGGVETDAMSVAVSGAAMNVTSPNINVRWFALSRRTVTWNVGGSAVHSPTVRILLSTNGGASYEAGTAFVLANNVPNTGSAEVTIPDVNGFTNRIFVEAQNGSFYDVSNVNFEVRRVSVTGRISLQYWTAPLAGKPVTIDLYPTGSATPIQTSTTTLNATGDYVFQAAIPTTGRYDIRVKASHWLARKRLDFAITEVGVTSVNLTLLNGDVDGDNEVGGGDVSALSSAYLSVAGDPNWNIEADLDGDGEVGSSDLSVLSTNFGLSGE